MSSRLRREAARYTLGMGFAYAKGDAARTDTVFVEERLHEKEDNMLWTIFVILLVLWLFGMVSSYTLGGFIHILLIIAVVVVAIRLIQGRRPL
jgi:hypothetical protein